MNIAKFVSVCGIAVAAGCGLADQGSARIEVTEANALGLRSLEVERTVEGGNSVTTLHAYSAEEKEIGSVRLTLGEIAELTTLLPGSSSAGSKIVASAGGHTSSLYSRETEHLRIGAGAMRDPAIDELLQISEVASTLAQEANIFVVKAPSASAESAYVATHFTQTCPAADMLNSSTAGQCCNYYSDAGGYESHHVNAAQASVDRLRNPQVSSCKAADGVSSCNGNACYFGPNGFGRPYVTVAQNTYGWTQRTGTLRDGFDCGVNWVGSSPSPIYYGNVLGTFPAAQGCPGGLSGAGDWDY